MIPDTCGSCHTKEREQFARGRHGNQHRLGAFEARAHLGHDVPGVDREGDRRAGDIHRAWDAYRAAWRSPEVRDFVTRCAADPGLLRHANETWAVGSA